MADDHDLNRVVGRDDERGPAEVMVHRPGTDGGVSARVDGPPGQRILRADVWRADGVMAGDENIQRNVSYLRLDEPRVTCDSAIVGAASMRAFHALTENPGSSLRRMEFQRALTRQRNIGAAASGRVAYGAARGPARVMSYSVRVRSSCGVVVGDRNVQSNRFNYTMKTPTLSIHEIAAFRPKVASMVVRLVARPDDEQRIRALGKEIDRAVHGLGDRLWLTPAVQSAPGLGRCAGIVIGRDNKQVNTSQVRVRSVDVDGVVASLREQASDAAEIRRLDAEYARLAALLDGPAAGVPVDLAAVGEEAIANRNRYLEIQERQLARFDDEAVITRGDRAEVAQLLDAARVAVAVHAASVEVWLAEAADPPSVPEPSKGILLRIAEALGLIRPREPDADIADISTLDGIDFTATPVWPDGPEPSVPREPVRPGEPERWGEPSEASPPEEPDPLDLRDVTLPDEPGLLVPAESSETPLLDGPDQVDLWNVGLTDALETSVPGGLSEMSLPEGLSPFDSLGVTFPGGTEPISSWHSVVEAAAAPGSSDDWIRSTPPSSWDLWPPALLDTARHDDIHGPGRIVDMNGRDDVDDIDYIDDIGSMGWF
ncbi:hypothetical protein FF36_03987 [Frankia torreyi]|uniref:Uncharacterized protein n=1 Tax=Frankia torreyi TaxID=1856 RepID=A0A0D8BCG2_9ACTN|nr:MULTISPECIES: hypothetical protein [Frankia]KJE21654.1 hypothetical protein FF36_03987 [Frankia torreyi]KQC34853.1 hypothetical protein UK82_29750 [Frankia sp. ACN1ag]